MSRFLRSIHRWLAGWSIFALVCGVVGAFSLGITLLIIGIAYELQPGFSVASLLAAVGVVTILGVELLDKLDARRRGIHNDGN